MSEDVYVRLAKFLDNLPGGYPATDTGVELKILEKLFTPRQAEIAMQLKQMPEPVSAIAERLGMDEKEAGEKLAQMLKEGSIMGIKVGDAPHYMALQFIVGIYEFHVNSLDKAIAELMEEYFPHLAKMWQSTKTKQMRVAPTHGALDSAPSVASYDQVREMAKNAQVISVANCICTQEKALLGSSCDRPAERCVQLNAAARFYIENGRGREITHGELMDILKMGEEQALVLSPNNAQDLSNFCLCCDCCCGILNVLRLTGEPAAHVQSAYQATIDPELCAQCGVCEDRCQIDAIKEGEETNEVDLKRCIGCGLCVPACPQEAISLVAKQNVPDVPANFIETNIRIAKERGVM